MKRIKDGITTMFQVLLCLAFVLIAAPVIHLSGLDKVDIWPDFKGECS